MSPVNESVKKQVLKSAEKLTRSSLDELVALAKVYAHETDSPIDDGVVQAVEMLRKVYLDGLVDKISDEV